MIAEQIEILNLNFKKNHSKCNIKNLNSSGDINSEQIEDNNTKLITIFTTKQNPPNANIQQH